MPTKEYIKNTVLKLRDYCKERNFNANDVYTMLIDEYGKQQVSKSSIIRLLKDDCDPASFNFELTVKPVSDLLLGIIEDSEDNGDNDEFDKNKAREYYLARNTLQEVVRLKTAEEERLRLRLETVERENDAELQRITEYQAKTIAILENNNDFLQKTIELVRSSLCTERDTNRQLHEEIKQLNESFRLLSMKITELESYHKKN